MDNGKDLRPRHSSYIPSTHLVNSNDRSEDLIIRALDKVQSDKGPGYISLDKKTEYKQYEYDAISVRESDSNKGSGDSHRPILTNSELNEIEKRVFQNVSQQLKTDGASNVSLDSNIQFFKTTVQGILDNFFTSVKDFERYKQKLNQILEKNQRDSVAEMEGFIKDMIKHIMSNSTISSETRKWSETISFADNREEVTPLNTNSDQEELNADTSVDPSTHQSVSIEFKNHNYQTDNSTIESTKKFTKREEILNIFLLSGGAPHIEIKMADRHLVSEINLNRISSDDPGEVASAENIKKVSAKRLQMENYSKLRDVDHIPDREIPVKFSHAKKNIHLNQDFAPIEKVDRRSFVTRICNFLCKKLRRS